MGNKAMLNCDIDKRADMLTVKNGSDSLENGCPIGIGHMVDKLLGNDTFQIVKLQEGKEWAILDDTGFQYDERLDESDYVLEENKTARARIPHSGLFMTLSKVHFEGAESLAEEDEIELKPGDYKFQKKDTGTAVGIIKEIYTWNGQESFYVQFK